MSLGFFAKRAIEANEELCYDYGEAPPDDTPEEGTSTQAPVIRKPCHCGTEKCRKYLPNLKIPEEENKQGPANEEDDFDDEIDDEYDDDDDDG